MSTITSTSESKNYFAMQTFFGLMKKPAYAISFADATASQEGYSESLREQAARQAQRFVAPKAFGDRAQVRILLIKDFCAS